MQIMPKKGLQVLCFHGVLPLSHMDVRSKTTLSSRKELIQVEGRAMQKVRVLRQPAKQVVYRLTAVFLGTAYFVREMSSPVPEAMLV